MAMDLAWARQIAQDILNFTALPNIYSTLQLERIKFHVPDMHLSNSNKHVLLARIDNQLNYYAIRRLISLQGNTHIYLNSLLIRLTNQAGVARNIEDHLSTQISEVLGRVRVICLVIIAISTFLSGIAYLYTAYGYLIACAIAVFVSSISAIVAQVISSMKPKYARFVRQAEPDLPNLE